MSIKDTITRFDEKFEDYYLVKAEVRRFIKKEIKLASEEITPKVKTEAYQDAKDEFMLIGWNDCIRKLEELKNNYLKLK